MIRKCNIYGDSSQKGATMLEFAICTGVFLLFIGGIIDLGLMMYSSSMMEHATKTTARDVGVRLQSNLDAILYHMSYNNLSATDGVSGCSKLDEEITEYLEEIASPKLVKGLRVADPSWDVQWSAADFGEGANIKITVKHKASCFFLCSLAKNGGWELSASSEAPVQVPSGLCVSSEFTVSD